MHGLICRSYEHFYKGAYGEDSWRVVMHALDLGFDEFEALFHYDDAILSRVVDATGRAQDKPRDMMLEDFGTYLVAGADSFRLRRLLRFGGLTYDDFLHSVEDLPGRAALAVPDLHLPALQLDEVSSGEFILQCESTFVGAGHVLLGLLRALADDYGALVFLDHMGRQAGVEVLSIQLVQADFSEGNGFNLAEMAEVVGG